MKKRNRWLKQILLIALLTTLTPLNLFAQTESGSPVWWNPVLFPESGENLRQRLGDLELVGEWIYDDLDEGFRRASATGKPLMVVFR